MTDREIQLAGLRRPKLLVDAAARAAISPCAARRAGRRPFAKLLAEEGMLNAARMGDGPGYSPRRHVQVLSALLCAARASDAPKPGSPPPR
jgi:hypothetical protein